MTREELYQSAREVVERRRLTAQHRARRLHDEAAAAAPELEMLERCLAEAGTAAALAAVAGESSIAAAKLAEAEALAAEKQALLAALGRVGAPRYRCTLCGDTGWHGGLTCACVHEEARRQRREEINRSGPFSRYGFENFSLDRYPETVTDDDGDPVRCHANMALILRECKDWAVDFGPRSQSLYMYGNAGLGKTHLALAIAGRVLEAGHDVIYVSAQRAFATIADWSDGGELFASMLEADLLVLDDLGTEFLNAYLRSRLYDLVNTRMGRRPTIYTSNICSGKLLEQRYDEKIASRFLGECHRMRFWGEDIRLQNR